ncbi:MAG TPA: OmpA family protein [Anaerolineae bacterium]|nr:OmpA family protein [Anaerolineae bacterium]
MKSRSKKPEDKGGAWLLTFNDMVTLLLTFLVLVLSLSEMDKSKLAALSGSMNAVFDTPKLKKEDVKVFTPFVIPIRNKAMMFEKKKRELAERVNKAAGMTAGTTGEGASAVPEGMAMAKVIKEGVRVTLVEKLLFEAGTAEIEEKNRPALKSLCSIFQKTDSLIRVEGHTDDIPINTPGFPSNWELSTARAVNVIKYFISQGGILPERLSAAGYGDSKPLLPNVSDHNRDINRRVEVILALKEE